MTIGNLWNVNNVMSFVSKVSFIPSPYKYVTPIMCQETVIV